MNELMQRIRDAEMQLGNYRIARSRQQPGGALSAEQLDQAITDQEADLAALRAQLDAMIMAEANRPLMGG